MLTRDLTSAELAVLSLIVERDLHGYEIEVLIQERGMRNWTEIAFSSIYHILRVLERELLVSSRIEAAPGKGPARKVFAATAEGRARYKREALRTLSTVVRPYPPILLGLAALPGLDPEEAADGLAAYRRGLAERLHEVQARNLPGLPDHVQAMFAHSEALIRAESEVVARIEARLRRGPGREGSA
ncbi:MAG TPA: helix-turn-helix transcriptional regulator [Rectinemataceae bacterium]|nr:helix-turn-helix transcriptional regulator [Rectinemataceae bacterium]